MRAGKYLAPVMAAAAFGVAGCGESNTVSLNKTVSPEAKTVQIDKALNSGKKITGVTVELDQTLPLATTVETCGIPQKSIYQPIKLGEGIYGFTCAQTGGKGGNAEAHTDKSITVHLVKATEALASVPTCPDQPVPKPHEASVTLQTVNYDKNLGGNSIYFVAANYNPSDQGITEIGIAQLPATPDQDPCSGVG